MVLTLSSRSTLCEMVIAMESSSVYSQGVPAQAAGRASSATDDRDNGARVMTRRVGK